MAARSREKVLRVKVGEFLENYTKYRESNWTNKNFSGPSLYFHRRALLRERDELDLRKIEMIYAMLVSWGMHTMGPKGPRMEEFDVFKRSIVELKDDITSLINVTPNIIMKPGWKVLEKIFDNIKVMATRARIIGNSKVMAHLLPGIVAPIDGEYTMRYLFGYKKYLKENEEWELIRDIHAYFYHPIWKNENYRKKAQKWVNQGNENSWDTSILKTIDNLVISAWKMKNMK